MFWANNYPDERHSQHSSEHQRAADPQNCTGSCAGWYILLAAASVRKWKLSFFITFLTIRQLGQEDKIT
jgi:hypothetical protein